MRNKLSLTEDFLPGEEEARDLFDVPEGPDPETLEGQGWEYVASKDVYDENGFRDVYYWYKKDGNNRFFFSSDVDYGDPEYFDWETDGEEAAQEWFDSYGEDESDLTLVDNREAAILGKGDDPGFDEYDRVDDNSVNEEINTPDEQKIKAIKDAAEEDWRYNQELSANEFDDFKEMFQDGLFDLNEEDFQLYLNEIKRLKKNMKDNLPPEKEIQDFLKELGGYSDYNQKIEDVMYEFGMDQETAESYVWDHANGLYKLRNEDDEVDESLKESKSNLKEENTSTGISQEERDLIDRTIRRVARFQSNAPDVLSSEMTDEGYVVEMDNSNPLYLADLWDELRKLEDSHNIGFDRESNDNGFYGYTYTFYHYDDVDESYGDDIKTISYKGKDIPVRSGAWQDVQNAHLFDKVDTITIGKHVWNVCKDKDTNEIFALATADTVDESFNNSSSSYYLTTVGDMIDGSVGNVDDEDIDKDLKFWRTVARTFNFVPGADNVAVLIADGEYDPEYYYPSWTNKPRAIAKKYPNAVFYDVPFFCVKEVKNGKMFLYFDSEESAKKYVDLIDSGIDFEDQSNFGNLDESINEDTVKQGSSWVNKGKEGTHGRFKTKKEANAQRKAMFAQGFKESLTEDPNQPTDTTVAGRLITAINDEWKTIDLYNSIISELSNTDGDDYKKMIPIIEDIVNEENVHVGQLQKALELISPDTVDIAKGEKEAEEQISGGDPADDKKALVDEFDNNPVKESLDDDYDDFELAGIYGGDLTYCPICGRRLQYDEDGDSFCPKCEKSAWDLAQERRKRDKSEPVDSSDDLSDEEMNEACGSNIETEENLDECDYNNLEDDPAVDVSDLRGPVDPHEKEKLQEFGPAAAAIVSAVAPVVADKVLDKILPENAPATTADETEVQGAGEEDDIDESVLNTL